MEAFNSKWRPSRKNRSQPAEIIIPSWFHSLLFNGRDITGTSSEDGYLLVLGQFPERPGVRIERRDIMCNIAGPQRRAGSQSAPSRPRAGGEVKNSVLP